MVELTEIKEEQNAQQPLAANGVIIESANNYDQEGDEDDDYEDSDFEDDFDENETIWERLAALKDVVPPKQRHFVENIFTGTRNIVSTLINKSGSITWMITTSAILLGVPLSLSILAEQQLIEMEKSFDLQKDANDILAQGDSATASPAAAI